MSAAPSIRCVARNETAGEVQVSPACEPCSDVPVECKACSSMESRVS